MPPTTHKPQPSHPDRSRDHPGEGENKNRLARNRTIRGNEALTQNRGHLPYDVDEIEAAKASNFNQDQ